MKVQTVSMTRQNIYGLRALWLTALAFAILLAQAITAQARPDSFADLAEKFSPAVVNITTSTVMAQGTGPSPIVPEGSPFEDFFRQFRENNENGDRPRRTSALGSGFVISEDGYVVTNNHVIESADEIIIEFYSGKELEAKVIGTDPKTDIALLKVDTKEPLAFVSFGDSDLARVGDWVVAMGNPLGQGFSVSAGIVSARNRALSGTYDDYIQTDAAINPGNSGGPPVNMNGELIGINSAIISRSGGNVGIGFAVPSEIARSIMNQILDFGEVRRGLLGVTIQTMDEESAEALGTDIDRGALITGIEPGSAAEEAGLQVDDIITGVNNKRIDDNRELANAIGLRGSGEEVRIEFVRSGRQRTVTAQLGQQSAQNVRGEDIHPRLQGALFPRSSTNSGGGVEVVSVEPESPAAQRDLRAGDVIVQANRQEVENLNQLGQIASGSRILFLLVRRGDRQLMLQIR